MDVRRKDCRDTTVNCLYKRKLKGDRPHPRLLSREVLFVSDVSVIHLVYQVYQMYVKPFSCESANKRTDRQADRQTDGRYQVHYLPRFAVDNYAGRVTIFLKFLNIWAITINHLEGPCCNIVKQEDNIEKSSEKCPTKHTLCHP